jgi:hypothetical protein
MLFGALAFAFLSSTGLWNESAGFFKRYAENLASRRVSWRECTPAMQSIQIFLDISKKKLWRIICTLWRRGYTRFKETVVFTRYGHC